MTDTTTALFGRPAGVPRGLHGLVLDVLGARIVSGMHLPGDVLAPDRLCASYSVSRTVLREVLRVLQDKGLIISRPNLGTRVRPIEEWNLLDADVLRWHAAAGSNQALDEHVRAFTEQLLALRPVLGENLLYRQLIATLTGAPRGQHPAGADTVASNGGGLEEADRGLTAVQLAEAVA